MDLTREPGLFMASKAWQAAYPGAVAGVLALREVANPARHEGLEARKAALEESIRARYAGWTRADLRALPRLAAYEAYYRRFQKTYHVQLQVESVALKGKPIPSVAALVEAMFMAELDSLLLTAGHDLATLALPVRVDIADGSETQTYTTLRGQDAALKPGDMYMADGDGIISSILSGPDRRTQITPETREALFAVYVPPGIGSEALEQHFQTIIDYARLISAASEVAAQVILQAK